MSLKDEVKEYLKISGRKKSWLAMQIEVTPSILSNWFGGRLLLNAHQEKLLKEIIKSKL